MPGIDFKDPVYLLLLIPFAAAVAWYVYRRIGGRGAAIAVSSASVVARRPSIRVTTYPYLPILRLAAVFLLILALARPGRSVEATSIKTPGIDIMVALDVSDSMMGEDFRPNNRLGVAKRVVRDFIERRPNDRVGLVVFSGDAYLHCPLTVDHSVVLDLVDELDFDTVEEEGTAIGEAIALAASRMLESGAKSRIIILLTDGMNNRGSIDPETAAALCAGAGIRVYPVGIGREGRVPYPSGGGIFRSARYLINHFDEKALRTVADVTEGKFYRAESGGVLWDHVRDIDRLEKSDIKTKVFHEFHDGFQFFLAAAMALFFLEILLRSAFYRKVP